MCEFDFFKQMGLLFGGSIFFSKLFEVKHHFNVIVVYN
jgi:hypothetical protein